MRLFTCNMLPCNMKRVVNNYVLRLEAEVEGERSVDFSQEFLCHIFGQRNWNMLVGAIKSLTEHVMVLDLPKKVETTLLDLDEFLHRFHRTLLKVHVKKGVLVCPQTGQRFPIDICIPN